MLTHIFVPFKLAILQQLLSLISHELHNYRVKCSVAKTNYLTLVFAIGSRLPTYTKLLRHFTIFFSSLNVKKVLLSFILESYQYHGLL